MNFLAHYHTTNQKIASYKLLGLILPDVAKDFSRIHNEKLEQDIATDLPYVLEMLEGIKLHVKGDDLFHKHRIFKQNELFAKQVLEAETKITVKRKFVIAHVIIELMIDQYIINKYPDKLEAFYKILEPIEIAKANGFFEMLDVKEAESQFINNFNHFRNRQFLYHLKEDKGVLLTLDKVFGRIFNYDFLQKNDIWIVAIKKIKLNLQKELPILLEELKENLYE